MSAASPRTWPLGSRDAADASATICTALDHWPAVRDKMHKRLSARLVGAVDREDMSRRLAEVHAEIRATLPGAPAKAGPS